MSAETTSVFPLVNPGKPSSLRRSHSVASESLPTPPSTIRKRPRTGSRSSVFSDDDEDDGELPRPLSPEPSKKKRRVDEAGKAVASGGDGNETEEDEFWGPNRAEIKKKKRPTAANNRRRKSPPAPKITDTASRAAAASTLLSPPPTRPRDPVTPPRRTSSKDSAKGKEKDKDKEGVRPVRDSPNNPFLVSLPTDAVDSDAESDVEVPSSPLGPKTPLPELPTMTYVLSVFSPVVACLRISCD